MFSRAAGTQRSATSSMRRPAPCMAPIRGCHSPRTRTSTIRCRSTQRPRKPPSSWRTPIRACMACRPRGCGSSPSMVHGDVRTWHCSFSPNRYSQANRSTCSTSDIIAAISPTLTTSSAAYWARSIECRPAMRPGEAMIRTRAPARRHIESTTSATAVPWS
jgi:hypothetical protein